jgi:phosphate transport system ATP-binding protein
MEKRRRKPTTGEASTKEKPPAIRRVEIGTERVEVGPERTPPPEDPAVLEIRDLSVKIGSKLIFEPVSLSIPERSITALMGPSGCGKSILLKSIIGLLRDEVAPATRIAYTGEVMFDGSNLLETQGHDLELIRRRVAYVSQRPAAFPGTIYENSVIALKYWRPDISRAESDAIVESALRQAALWDELKHRLNDSARELSSGQLQRLCVARAATLNPEVFLLDEPCAYIDPVSTLAFEEWLREIRQEHAVFIVTHNMQQAARVSDRTAMMTVKLAGNGHDLVGKVIELDATGRIFTRPGERITEDFISGRFG